MKPTLSSGVLQTFKPSMLIVSPFVCNRVTAGASAAANRSQPALAPKAQWLAQSNASQVLLHSACRPLARHKQPLLVSLSSYGAAAQGALGAMVSATLSVGKTIKARVVRVLTKLAMQIAGPAHAHRQAFAALPGQPSVSSAPIKAASAQGAQLADAYKISKLAGFELEQTLLSQANISPVAAKAEAKRLQMELLADFKAVLRA